MSIETMFTKGVNGHIGGGSANIGDGGSAGIEKADD